MNPYVIPDDGFFRTINVSGGRSSGYLLYKILYANGGLPKTAKAVFANTGKEREETLEFIHEIETRWSVPIVWLEHTRDESRRGVRGDPKNTFKTVDFLGIRSERGNCDLCYLKGKQNLLETIREEPKRADWWIAQELKVSGYRSHDRKKEVDQFSNRWSFRELREEALSQSKLDGWNEAVADCFCGD